MGNSVESKSFLQKGEGLRILSIKLNCPFDGRVEPFFDFIIDIIPLEPQTSPKEILDKLTSQSTKSKGTCKDFNQIVVQNENRKLQIKILSTKYRNVRSLIITPNRNWNGSKDLIGITVRKEKYDQVFQNYFPITKVQNYSPIHLAGVKDGEYLLGCLEFPFLNIDHFIQGLYDRFFDKQVADKHVHLALYNILEDQVSIKPVLLKRGWGGSGILGCQFLQGYIFRFPANLKERRETVLQQTKIKQENQRIKNDIAEQDGSSKTLFEALKDKQSRKGKKMQKLKNIIQIPNKQSQNEQFRRENQRDDKENQDGKALTNQLTTIRQQNLRIGDLEGKISFLEETLLNMRQYLDQKSREQYDGEQDANQQISAL